MNRKAWAFFFGLLVAAATVLVVTRGGYLDLRPSDSAGLLVFAILGVASESMALDFRVGAKEARSSVLYLPVFACAITFPPYWTLVTTLVMVGVADLLVKKRRAWVSAFNASQEVVSLFAALTVYYTLGGHVLSDGSAYVPEFFALAVCYFLANFAIVGGFIAVRTGRPIVVVLKEMVGPTGGNLFYGVLASPIAYGTALLYVYLHVGGVLLGVLPLLLVRYSYESAVQYRDLNKDLMRVLNKAIETRDPYTSGHSLRVSALARSIAEAIGLRRRQVERVETAASLHDIGKIESLYASIIGKPHDLSPHERAVIQTHPTRGADMLLELSAFKDDEIVKGVRHHHERFDGTGYPDRLRGEEIPVAARIIMICDALDAMLSDRPYRRALDMESVRRELVRCSGTQFDPAIVRVVLERGTIELAHELVRKEPPDAMAHPTLVSAVLAK